MSDYHDAMAAPAGGEWERLRQRIVQLESELERYREREELVAKTLVSAASHAAAIRESARRDAELTLRKARGKAEKRRAAALRERDDAKRELMRLLRITEQMRRGLSEFLTAKVDELRPEGGGDGAAPHPTADIGAALGSALERQPATVTPLSVSTSHPQAEFPDRSGDGSIGGSPDGVQ